MKNCNVDGRYYLDGQIKFPSKLWKTPTATEVPKLHVGDIKGYYLDSVDYRGKPTKIFAYLGVPKFSPDKTPVTKNSKLPAVVLVHGGSGTAFAEWVKVWNDRGYVAIAMDTFGHQPTLTSRRDNFDRDENPFGGPDLAELLSDFELPIENQWAYQAVASVIVSNSFVRSIPVVDQSRVALTGISYGSFLTCQTLLYDNRFVCAVPVYGSYELRLGDTIFANGLKPYPRKIELWDNPKRVGKNDVPVLFVAGNIDPYFSVLGTTESCKLRPRSKMLIVHEYPHSHYHGSEYVPEIFDFIDGYCLGKSALPSVKNAPTAENPVAVFDLPNGNKITSATAYFTDFEILKETTVWQKKNCVIEGEKISVGDLDGARYFYFEITDLFNRRITTSVVKK